MYTIFNIVYLQACKMDDLKTLYLLANSFRWGEECQASSPKLDSDPMRSLQYLYSMTTNRIFSCAFFSGSFVSHPL